jgi:hypothetical protein
MLIYNLNKTTFDIQKLSLIICLPNILVVWYLCRIFTTLSYELEHITTAYAVIQNPVL